MQDTDRQAVRAGRAVAGGWHSSDLRRLKTGMCVPTLRGAVGGGVSVPLPPAGLKANP